MTDIYATIYCDVLSSGNIRTEWKRRVTIPFTPWVGLQIRAMSEKDSHVVNEIEWSLKDREWTLFREEEQWTDKVNTDVLSEMTSDGWTMRVR